MNFCPRVHMVASVPERAKEHPNELNAAHLFMTNHEAASTVPELEVLLRVATAHTYARTPVHGSAQIAKEQIRCECP